MAMQGSRQANPPIAGGATEGPGIRNESAAAVRIVVLTLGAVAVWMACVIGFQLVAEHTFGFTPQDAWGLSLAIITYLAGFIGVIVGIIMLVHRADEDFLARTEHPSPPVARPDAAPGVRA